MKRNLVEVVPAGALVAVVAALAILAAPLSATAGLLPMAFRPALSGIQPIRAAVPVTERILVESQDDLPRHTFPVEGTVSELVESAGAFGPFAEALRASLEADLAAYDIRDKTSLQGYLNTLVTLDLIAGDWDAARKTGVRVKELEDKDAAKLLGGLALEARLAARDATGTAEPTPAFREAYREKYADLLADLPWEIVGDNLEGQKSQLEMVSENLLIGLTRQQLDPVAAKTGEIGGSLAAQVAGFHWMLHGGLDLKDETLAVLTGIIAKNRVEKVDIWAARDVDLGGAEGLTPVVVAIWDTGVDVDLFPGRLLVNESETEDGKDDDGNGWVDDRYGIAIDLRYHRTSGVLFDVSGATRPVAELQDDMKGLFDMRASIDSPEATALRGKFASLGPEGVKPLIEDLGRYSLYCHGTHVAGIAVAGNPAARILVCRLTGDPHMIPEAPTFEEERRGAMANRDIVAYFREKGVRVVNMSWVIQASSYEAALEANGIGTTAEERRTMGREMFEIAKKGLHEAFTSAPEILFVGGAGNSDNDIEFDEFIPPAFRLPNLLIAGAVDQAGDATSFTSFGPTVNVYSNGFEVDSYVPGGDRMRLSGTSMASPNIVNLAAKLFALDPSLTPADVIELILDGCDVIHEGDQEMHVIHPKRSVELLRDRRG